MKRHPASAAGRAGYPAFLDGIRGLIEHARRQSAWAVNSILTATYWEIGRRIVEREQKGRARAAYGEALLRRLSDDLSGRFGKGFSLRNLRLMRQLYVAWSPAKIRQTLSADSAVVPRPRQETPLPALIDVMKALPLSWSHYVRLLQVGDTAACEFYAEEALRGGWSVRQLDRQIESRFFERTALSKRKAAMLRQGAKQTPSDQMSPEEAIKDPYVLEFLGLKDEYSESDLEEALIRHLETFLLELGNDFAFIARQKRLRVDDEWYRVDLLFYHRRLRCLVLVDLKLGRLTHSDAGQMHLYLNYAAEHWTQRDEKPPVGLILCARRGEEVARYALAGLPNKVLAAEYSMKLPSERLLRRELARTRLALEGRSRRE